MRAGERDHFELGGRPANKCCEHWKEDILIISKAWTQRSSQSARSRFVVFRLQHAHIELSFAAACVQAISPPHAATSLLKPSGLHKCAAGHGCEPWDDSG